MTFDKSIFIFRRDLRLADNLALEQACEQSKSVIPIFIFDPRQVAPHPYRSEPGLEFLLNSLEELKKSLLALGSDLYCFFGLQEEILPKIIKESKAEAIYCSKDYTPFSIKRDLKIKETCDRLNLKFYDLPNHLLNEPDKIFNQSSKPYTVYTFYAKAAAKIEVPKPSSSKLKNFLNFNFSNADLKISIEEIRKKYCAAKNELLIVKGGREEALKLLTKIPGMGNYNDDRNFPALASTSLLSAHNKFGTISIRELYHKIADELGSDHTLIKELYWRDFFTQIAFHFPHVFERAFNKNYSNIEWEENDQYLEAWQNGQTGFPIVDAGMRELNATGFMHNRVRMIVASFLCKDLLINWQDGERYFARKLVDYDPCVNNGNWQWAASTGCDAQPYFRVFNPWLQGQKFDKEALYIKKWVPELSNLDAKHIHKLFEEPLPADSEYSVPIVEHAEQKTRAIRLFKS